jgi:hypothetical protein
MRARIAGMIWVAAAGFALVAAPADASKLGSSGGFTYAKKSADLPDTFGATATSNALEAHCPKGSEPVGGGTSVTGAAGGSYVSMTGPEKTGWSSGGWHYNLPVEKVTAWGICSERKSKVRVSSQVVNVAGGSAGTSAVSCGQDAVVGGGARPTTRPEEFWLNRSEPQDTGADADDKPDDAWFGSIWHQAGFFPPIDVSIDAVCMEDVKPTYRVQGVAFSTQTVIDQTIACPKKKSVVGGGPSVSGPASQTHVVVTAPVDTDDRGKVPDDGWTITVSNPAAAEIDVVVYAVCV